MSLPLTKRALWRQCLGSVDRVTNRIEPRSNTSLFGRRFECHRLAPFETIGCGFDHVLSETSCI